jgi:hypothetical protein
MRIIDLLSSAMKKEIEKEVDIRSLNKARLIEDLDKTILKLNTFHEATQSMMFNEGRLFLTKYNTLVENTSYPQQVKDSYNKYVATLDSRIRPMEKQQPFYTLIASCGIMSDLLNEVRNNIDKIFDSQKQDIVIRDVRVSTASFLGLIKSGESLARYSSALFNIMSSVVLRSDIPVPAIHTHYVTENTAKVAYTVSQLLSKQGIFWFLNGVKEIRVKNADVALVGRMGGSPARFVDGIIPPFVYHLLEYALSVINIFSWSQKRWDDYMDDCNRKNVADKEWLELVVTTLKDDLNGRDPNSSEAIKKRRHIASYERQITDLQVKIDDYYRGD